MEINWERLLSSSLIGDAQKLTVFRRHLGPVCFPKDNLHGFNHGRGKRISHVVQGAVAHVRQRNDTLFSIHTGQNAAYRSSILDGLKQSNGWSLILTC
jgi:hypothetical protein